MINVLGGLSPLFLCADGENLGHLKCIILDARQSEVLKFGDEKSLDIYEGYPKYYIKKDIEVIADKYGSIKGMVYVMADGLDIQCPLDTYVETCSTGYEQFDFDKFPIYCALADAVRYKMGDKYYEAFLKNCIGGEL